MLTYNCKIEFNNEQDKQQLLSLISLQKDIWNYCSNLYFNKKIPNTIKDIHHLCYYPSKKYFPNSPAQLIIRAQKDVLSTYRSIKSNYLRFRSNSYITIRKII